MMYYSRLTLAGYQVSTDAPSFLLLLRWAEERKYNKNLTGQDQDRERLVTVTAKTDSSLRN